MRYTLIVGLSLGTLLLPACSNGDTGTSPNPSGVNTVADPSFQVPNIAESGSRPFSYRSVKDLAADSHIIVRGKATGQSRIEYVEDIPFDVVEFEVSQVLAGEPLANNPIWIRTATYEEPTKGDGNLKPVLADSRRNWLLFLTPFVFSDGKPTGQWVTTGGSAGLFLGNGNGRFLKIDRDSKELPNDVGVDEMRSLQVNNVGRAIDPSALLPQLSVVEAKAVNKLCRDNAKSTEGLRVRLVEYFTMPESSDPTLGKDFGKQVDGFSASLEKTSGNSNLLETLAGLQAARELLDSGNRDATTATEFRELIDEAVNSMRRVGVTDCIW